MVSQPSGEDIGAKQIQTGTTTEDECHQHTFDLDPKGNGWTSYTQHPQSDKVRHRHRIIGYVVQRSTSDCYPNCELEYGVKGVPMHDHKLIPHEAENMGKTKISLEGQLGTATRVSTPSITPRIPIRPQGTY